MIHPISIPSLIGRAMTLNTEDKSPVLVAVIFLCCLMVAFKAKLLTVQVNVSPFPSQVKLVIVKGKTVTDTGTTVRTSLDVYNK